MGSCRLSADRRLPGCGSSVDITGTSRPVICHHDDDLAFYLFRCDDLWQIVADTWHETLEAAIHQAEAEYVVLAWQAVS